MRWSVEQVGLALFVGFFVVAGAAGTLGIGDTSADTPEPVGTNLPDQTTETNTKEWNETQRSQLSAAVVFQINEYRSENGVQSLRRTDALDSAARDHAVYLNQSDQWGHEGRGDSSASERVGECFTGEVVTGAYTQESVEETAERAVQQFIDSKPHRKVLLDDSHSAIGVGVKSDRQGAVLRVVVDFCE